MKENDCVKLIVEKEEYAKEGIHKGMVGVVMHLANSNPDSCLVGFDFGNPEDSSFKFVMISVKIKDLILVYLS